MVLDWKADRAHANRHDILDAATGDPLPRGMAIFYADDAAGVLRVHRKNALGRKYLASKSAGLPVVFGWPDRPSPSTVPFAVRPDGTREETTDDDVEVASEEIRRPIRIVPRTPA